MLSLSLPTMKLYNFYIKYRFIIGIVTLALAIVANILWGFWPSLTLYLIAIISIFTHFFIGPLRLIQEYLEEGDFEGAEKVLNGIQYPNLLYKPIRFECAKTRIFLLWLN